MKSTRFRKEAKEFIPEQISGADRHAKRSTASNGDDFAAVACTAAAASSQQQLPTPLLQPPQQPAHPQPPQPPQQVPVQPQPQLQPREAMQPQPTVDPSLQQSSSTQPQSELNADASTRPPPSEVPPRPSSARELCQHPHQRYQDSAAPPPTPPQPKPLFDAGDFPPPISVALGAAGKVPCQPMPIRRPHPPLHRSRLPSCRPPRRLLRRRRRSPTEADFPSPRPGDPPPGGAPGAVGGPVHPAKARRNVVGQ